MVSYLIRSVEVLSFYAQIQSLFPSRHRSSTTFPLSHISRSTQTEERVSAGTIQLDPAQHSIWYLALRTAQWGPIFTILRFEFSQTLRLSFFIRPDSDFKLSQSQHIWLAPFQAIRHYRPILDGRQFSIFTELQLLTFKPLSALPKYINWEICQTGYVYHSPETFGCLQTKQYGHL